MNATRCKPSHLPQPPPAPSAAAPMAQHAGAFPHPALHATEGRTSFAAGAEDILWVDKGCEVDCQGGAGAGGGCQGLSQELQLKGMGRG